MGDSHKPSKPKAPDEAKGKDTYNPVNMAGKKAEIVSDDVDTARDDEQPRTVTDDRRNSQPASPKTPKKADR